MKKWKKITIFVVLAAVAVFALCLALRWPVYPDFSISVDTYDDLSEPFEDSPVIFLPQEDHIPASEYQILLDNRHRLSRKIGYCISKETMDGSTKIHYLLRCGEQNATPCDGAEEYNGVAFETIVFPQTEQSASRTVVLNFDIDGVPYRFAADYSTVYLENENKDVTEMDAYIEAQLFSYAAQIIDQYHLNA
ncbi:MAG: hypothetical protein E7464_01495 [Ruminococcaceae bacterium]|nr:hypothetical protein [Oscillospiraceae bacterium]